MSEERVVYCWEDGPKEPDEMSTTCLLIKGHDGPHEWRRDDEIVIRFPPEQ